MPEGTGLSPLEDKSGIDNAESVVYKLKNT